MNCANGNDDSSLMSLFVDCDDSSSTVSSFGFFLFRLDDTPLHSVGICSFSLSFLTKSATKNPLVKSSSGEERMHFSAVKSAKGKYITIIYQLLQSINEPIH